MMERGTALRSRLINALIMPYYAIRNTWPIWFYVLNKEPREKFARDGAPALDAARGRVLDDLRKDGVAITSLDELFPGTGYLETLQAYAAPLRANAFSHAKKDFLLQLLETHPHLDPKNPFVRLALEERVIDILNSYQQMWTKLSLIHLNVTLPVPPGTPPKYSQNWHRDPADKKITKMFLYLNDVDAASGPFTYVRGSQYGGTWRRIFPQRLPHGCYPPPGAVERRVPASDIRVCTGKAGTVIFADTSGLHKGGYATGHERTMFTAGYDTKASPRGIFFRYPEQGMDELTRGMSAKTVYAVTGRKYGEGSGY